MTDYRGWMRMWFIAMVVFMVAKLAVLAHSGKHVNSTSSALVFVTMWPGFDVQAWSRRPTVQLHLLHRVGSNLALGISLTWGLARYVSSPLYAGWVAMIGFVVLLHGAFFTSLTLFWRNRGRDVKPLMECPLAAASLSEFWGKRWNLGFRDLAHTLIFKPLRKRHGKGIAILMVFLASGLVHELVITVPAQSGYGGPTLYFLLQPIGMWMERRCTFTKRGLLWRLCTLIFLIAPLPLLFPAAFVERVMHPFFTAIHALP